MNLNRHRIWGERQMFEESVKKRTERKKIAGGYLGVK